MTDRKPALRFVFFVVLLDLLGIGLLIPVGPKLVTQLSGGSEADAAPLVGWLGATFSIMAFLCAPLLGALSDRVGRRPVLLFSMLGSGLDYFAMALAPS
ncbi:MAG: MFS transporter, partial [Planctomycetota bacterium]